jgi:hypothetical protein
MRERKAGRLIGVRARFELPTSASDKGSELFLAQHVGGCRKQTLHPPRSCALRGRVVTDELSAGSSPTGALATNRLRGHVQGQISPITQWTRTGLPDNFSKADPMIGCGLGITYQMDQRRRRTSHRCWEPPLNHGARVRRLRSQSSRVDRDPISKGPAARYQEVQDD